MGAPDVVRRLEEAGPQARFTRRCVPTHGICHRWSTIEPQHSFVTLSSYVCFLCLRPTGPDREFEGLVRGEGAPEDGDGHDGGGESAAEDEKEEEEDDQGSGTHILVFG